MTPDARLSGRTRRRQLPGYDLVGNVPAAASRSAEQRIPTDRSGRDRLRRVMQQARAMPTFPHGACTLTTGREDDHADV